MLKNYFLTAWRSLWANKLSSLINITGLALGLAITIIFFLGILDTLSYVRYHVNYPNIYQLMKTVRNSGGVSTGSSVPGGLASAVRAEIPEVQYAARIAGDEPLLQFKGKALYQQAFYADPDFFRIMTYPAVQGDPAIVLKDPQSIVLTVSAAKRLFGQEDPLGKTLLQNGTRSLKVGAIIKDIPDHSTYHFDVVLPFAAFEKENDWLKKWDDNRIPTWVLLKPHTDIAALNVKLTRLLRQKANDPRLELFAYSMENTWLRNSFKNGHPDGGRINGMKMVTSIALLVLLVACINFMNLSTARSEKRSREVGVRKTLGASRRQLIFQFLSEAFLLTFLALFLSILLARLLLPFFNRFMSKNTIAFDLDSAPVWLALLTIGLITALVAGSYPAFFLSRFRPVQVLKGLFTPGKGNSRLRRGLVTFQFVIAITMIISVLVIIREQAYVESRPIGYEPENLISIPARGEMAASFGLIKNELVKIPGITQVSGGTDDLLNFGAGSDGFTWPGKTADQNFYMKVTQVGYDWVKTAGLQLAEGRDFSPEYPTDTSAYLVNETAIKKMGLKEPVLGTRLGNSPIIGVIKDFAFNDVFNKPDAMVIGLRPSHLDHFFVRIRNNAAWQQNIARIEGAIKKVNPGYPFEFRFVSEQYQEKFNGIQSTVTTLNWIGSFAILISCLGLFGLSVFLAERRSKEMGIRKILGAGNIRIWFNLSKDFLKPVGIAFAIAAPLAGWIMHTVLQHFQYRIDLSWWIFALAGLITLFIALLTISIQGIRSATANPLRSLRTE